MKYPDGQRGRRLGAAVFVIAALAIALIVILDLPQWAWLLPTIAAGVGASMYVGRGGYGGRERDGAPPPAR